MLTNIFYDAKANIKGGMLYPKINGIVTFKETKNGVLITAKIKELPQLKTNAVASFLVFIYTKEPLALVI